ncbi:hypothetical protein, partial [Labrenzia sp. C1B10]
MVDSRTEIGPFTRRVSSYEDQPDTSGQRDEAASTSVHTGNETVHDPDTQNVPEDGNNANAEMRQESLDLPNTDTSAFDPIDLQSISGSSEPSRESLFAQSGPQDAVGQPISLAVANAPDFETNTNTDPLPVPNLDDVNLAENGSALAKNAPETLAEDSSDIADTPVLT